MNNAKRRILSGLLTMVLIVVALVSPEFKVNAASASRANIEAFVGRMYTEALNREAEPAGLMDWSNQLEAQTIDGAGVARGFICSNEFVNRNLSDSEYVDTLYFTFFNRPADEGGKNNWLQVLSNGGGRTEVLAGFVNSQEFSILCDSYGIARGTMQPDGSSIYREGVRNYVLRMYTKALNRNGETVGVEDWTNRINTGVMSAEDVAKNFFNSQEFINRNLSDEDYVEVLYATFMDRESDAGGKGDWVQQLKAGKTRQEVLEGFSRSPEFKNIMIAYGLIPSTDTPTVTDTPQDTNEGNTGTGSEPDQTLSSGVYAVNSQNGKIHIVGSCSATGNGGNAMEAPVYFNTYEEAEAYSVRIAPRLSKRQCGNCW